jgi:hypothetical protein
MKCKCENIDNDDIAIKFFDLAVYTGVRPESLKFEAKL